VHLLVVHFINLINARNVRHIKIHRINLIIMQRFVMNGVVLKLMPTAE